MFKKHQTKMCIGKKCVMLIHRSTASERALMHQKNTTTTLDKGVHETDLPSPTVCSGRAATFMWYVRARFVTL